MMQRDRNRAGQDRAIVAIGDRGRRALRRNTCACRSARDCPTSGRPASTRRPSGRPRRSGGWKGRCPRSATTASRRAPSTAISTAGISQSAPRIRPIATAIGTCSQSTASRILLVVSRRNSRDRRSRWSFPVSSIKLIRKQAAIACGSMTSQAPALRSRASPSCRSGRTTRSDGSAVILTIAASAEAAARNARSALHHGGNATATISVPGRTCNDSAATAIQLATSNAAAFSQAGHRGDEMVLPRSIARDNTHAELMTR